MGSSVLSEVDDTSILRTGLSTCYWRPLNWLRPLGSCPRAAGWSAATLCIGPSRPCLKNSWPQCPESGQTGTDVNDPTRALRQRADSNPRVHSQTIQHRARPLLNIRILFCFKNQFAARTNKECTVMYRRYVLTCRTSLSYGHATVSIDFFNCQIK